MRLLTPSISSLASRTVRLLPALAAGLAVVGLAAGPASATAVPVPLNCQATPPIGPAQSLSLTAGVNGTAPAAVRAGSAFTITLSPAPMAVPGSVSGYAVRSISDLRLSLRIPANATLTGESLSGGSGYGPGMPTLSVGGDRLVATVPGPIPGGAMVTLPTLTLRLVAGGTGGSITTRLAGTGYGDPALSFSTGVQVSILTIAVPTGCYASPNPVLTSTSVR